jgi:hypothetical protein
VGDGQGHGHMVLLFRADLMKRREVEVAAVMRWVMDNPFLLSLSFHDGRVLVNYPWDDSPQAVEGEKVRIGWETIDFLRTRSSRLV